MFNEVGVERSRLSANLDRVVMYSRQAVEHDFRSLNEGRDSDGNLAN